MGFIHSIYSANFAPVRNEEIYEWAFREVVMDSTAPIPGPYRVDLTPMMREPLKAFRNESIRHILTIGPNQGGRTKCMEVALLWTINNRPGPTQWNTDTNDKAKDHAEERVWPTADQIAEVVELYPANHDRKRNTKVIFSNGCPYIWQGANDTNFQQKSVKNQFNDEIYKWKVGMLNEAHKRADVSYAATHKIWDSSVPGNEDTELHEAWTESSRGEWSLCCPKCKQFQAFKWLNLKWDTNETTKPSGVYNYAALRKTVRYHCDTEACGKVFADTYFTRKAMNASACYIHANPDAKTKGFRYNALAVNWPGITWGQFIEEFLRAKRLAKTVYNIEPLRLFFTRRMAEFWDEDRFLAPTDKRTESDYSLRDGKGLNLWLPPNLWGDEWGRFLGADKQVDHYPYVIRAVKSNGESRMMDCGMQIQSYEELAEKAREFAVKSRRVLIDCSYERGEVYAAAIKHQWTCMRGSDKESFSHFIKDGTAEKLKRVDRPYSVRMHGDPGGAGSQAQRRRGQVIIRHRMATVFEWSNLTIKNTLSALKHGRASLYYGIPADASQAYIDQMNSEVRYRKTNGRGRLVEWWSNCGRDGKGTKKPNHFWDCECEILTAFIMQGLISWDDWQTVAPDLANNEAPTQGEAGQFDYAEVA